MRKLLCYCKDSQTLEEASHRGYGDFQYLTGHGPEQLAVGDPAVSRGWTI